VSETGPLLTAAGLRLISRVLPEFCKSPLRKIYLRAKYARLSSKAPNFCPVCKRGVSGFRVIEWGDTRCVFCDSVSRQRLVWSFFLRCTDLFDERQKQMLHVAPEMQFERILSKVIGKGYITADLLDPRVRVRMDITEIQAKLLKILP
jgi:hypothetical protein